MERRVRSILSFPDDRRVALPPEVLYDDLVTSQDVTFSYRTVKRSLAELREDGRVEYVDRGHGYYRVSERERAFLDDD